jgi:hypothetical protein
MWVYTRSRGEHDRRFLLNLSHCSRISVSQLGERWFLEVILGNDTLPIASVNSQEEAETLLERLYACLKADAKAMDLDAPEEKPEDRRKESGNAGHPGAKEAVKT